MPNRHQIERLKGDWLADGRLFVLEDVEGFEEHRAELRLFRLAVEERTDDAFRLYLEELAPSSEVVSALRAFAVENPEGWAAARLDSATKLKMLLRDIGTGIFGERAEADQLFRKFERNARKARRITPDNSRIGAKRRQASQGAERGAPNRMEVLKSGAI